LNILENAGRRMVFWGSIILMSWALYEFIVMFSAMFGLIRTIFEISADAQYPISNAISIMMRNSGTQFITLLFLFCCVLLGLYALLTRRRPVLCFFDVPLCVLFALYILGRTSLVSANLLQKLKLIPFVLIGAGGLICFIFALSRGLKKRQNRHGDPPPTRPYDPFRINRP
jgi:hypothetical protein